MEMLQHIVGRGKRLRYPKWGGEMFEGERPGGNIRHSARVRSRLVSFHPNYSLNTCSS